VLLVEGHELFVHLLAIALVLGLELLDLGLYPLHLAHRLRLLDRQRQEDHPHEDGQQDDRQSEARDEGVEAG
jgi:hypothetical protein